MDRKRCPKCGEVKEIEGNFSKDRSQADGLQSRCKPCAYAATGVWKIKNAERVRGYYSEYNPQYYLANKVTNIAAAKIWAEANREKRREICSRYSKAHPEKGRASAARRKALKLGYEGEHYSDADLAACLKAQDGCCWYCGFPLPASPHGDHVVPLSRGGGNGAENIVLSCPPCNFSKHNRLLGLEWVPPICRILGQVEQNA